MKPKLPDKSIIDNQAFGRSPTLVTQQTTNPGFAMQNQFQDRTQTKKNYIGTDLFWLVNLKLMDDDSKDLDKNEADLCIISYNPNYSNLCLSLRDFTSTDAASEYRINISMCRQTTRISIGPEAAMELLYNMNQKKIHRGEIPIMERVFSSWTPNKTTVSLLADGIVLETETNNTNKYSYTFLKWQLDAFKKSLEFITSNRTWIYNLQTSLNKLT
jgi:hypothetical protein